MNKATFTNNDHTMASEILQLSPTKRSEKNTWATWMRPENWRVLPPKHLPRSFSGRAAEAGVSSSPTPPAASSHPWAAHSRRNSCASTMQRAVREQGLGIRRAA